MMPTSSRPSSLRRRCFDFGAVARGSRHQGSVWVVKVDVKAPESLLESPDRFLNRELSWLDFADRLVDLAADDDQPLLERVKFIAIWSAGLDEFFQVRVGGPEGPVAAGVSKRSPDGMTAAEQLKAIGEQVHPAPDRAQSTPSSATRSCPASARGRRRDLTSIDDLDDAERAELLGVFERDIFPVLTPLAVDPATRSRTSRTCRSTSA